jgi:Flp pilus assembly pilin Flp
MRGRRRRPEEAHMQMLRNFWNDESGQGLVEYIAIIALIAIGMFVVLRAFRGRVGNVYNNVGGALETEIGTGAT